MYALTVYNQNISINSTILEQEFYKGSTLDNNEEFIDFIDVEYQLSAKKADKLDYGAAIFSGLVSFALKKYLVSQKKTDKKEIDDADIISIVNELKDTLAAKRKEVKDIDNWLNNLEKTVTDKLNGIDDSKEAFKDFVNEFSYDALFMCIYRQIKSGKNNNTIYENVLYGVIDWLMYQADQYSKTGKFKEYSSGFMSLKKGIENLKPIIIEWAAILKNGEMSISDITNELKLKVHNYLSKRMSKIATFELLPVLLNSLIVEAYFLCKITYEQIEEHSIHDIQGLSIIDLNKAIDDNQRVKARLDSVSSGVFAGLDVIVAAGITARKVAGDLKDVNLNDKDKDKVELILDGIKIGINAITIFTSEISIEGVAKFTAALGTDFEYIKQDIIDRPNKLKNIKAEKIVRLSNEEITKYLTLNDISTKILYSLQLHLLNYDIQKTKESDDQKAKTKWKYEWMIDSVKATGLAKLYEEDEEKLYSLIQTYRSTNQERQWLYQVLLETLLFNPYTKIKYEKNEKKQKLTYKAYLKDVFCGKYDIVDYKEVNDLNNTFKKYYGNVTNSTERTIATAAGITVVTIATAGAAYVFAPTIAVGLAGGAFSGLHGAALTSASLAFFGGGSLAAGGLGMAGGTIVIAGGGALVGATSASGISAAAFALQSGSKYIQLDNAKLLTECDFVFANKLNNINLIKNIQLNTQSDIEEIQLKIKTFEYMYVDLKNDKEKNKQLSDLKKSLKALKNTNNDLKKIIKRAEKK